MQTHLINIGDGIIGGLLLLVIVWVIGQAWRRALGWWQREREAERRAGINTAQDTQGLLILGLGLLLFALLCLLAAIGLSISAYLLIVPKASLFALLPLVAVGYGMWGCSRGINIISTAQDHLLQSRAQILENSN